MKKKELIILIIILLIVLILLIKLDNSNKQCDLNNYEFFTTYPPSCPQNEPPKDYVFSESGVKYPFAMTSYCGEINDTKLENIKEISLNRPYEKGPYRFYGTMYPGRNYIFDNAGPDRGNLKILEYDKSYNSSGFLNITKDKFYSIMKGTWIEADELSNLKQYKNVFGPPKCTGQIGNLFANGAFVTKISNLKIPVYDISHPKFIDYIQFFSNVDNNEHCDLIKFGDPLPRTTQKCNLIQYEVFKEYIPCEVYSKPCGSGPFIEYHNFQHYITPQNNDPDQQDIIILGKFDNNNNKNTILLSAFKVPFGYTLYVPSNTLHDDWWSVGKGIISLIDGEGADAHTVFFRHKERSKWKPVMFNLKGKGFKLLYPEPPSVPCPVRLGNPITTKLDPRTHSFLPMKKGFYADV